MVLDPLAMAVYGWEGQYNLQLIRRALEVVMAFVHRWMPNMAVEG